MTRSTLPAGASWPFVARVFVATPAAGAEEGICPFNRSRDPDSVPGGDRPAGLDLDRDHERRRRRPDVAHRPPAEAIGPGVELEPQADLRGVVGDPPGAPGEFQARPLSVAFPQRDGDRAAVEVHTVAP